MYAKAYAQNYHQIDLEAEVEQANAHRLVAMLYEGFLLQIAKAKVGVQQDNFEAKAKHTHQAMDILLGLKAGLDHEASPELAGNLHELYDYCERKLLDASASRDLAGYDEVDALIRQVKEAWDAIGQQVNEAIPA